MQNGEKKLRTGPKKPNSKILAKNDFKKVFF